jgi:hypothetical protein
MQYEVRVVGQLPESARDEFAQLEVERHPVETVLHGPVAGSKALVALLVRLECLGLRLVEFHRLPDGPADAYRPYEVR